MVNRTATQTRVMSAGTLIGDDVVNPQGDNLGNIEEIMLDMNFGRVSYAVLSFGGFLGLGDKLFAIPWDALTLDTQNERMVLNIDQETLKNAKGFDKDNWPQADDQDWLVSVYEYYDYSPYWLV